MSDIKKDHSIGEGTGAVAGGITGSIVGSAAGPLGTVVGAIAGGAMGAKGGGALAEAVNPTEYSRYFEDSYKRAPYFVSGSEWRDYEPAYKYSYDAYGKHDGKAFEEVQDTLERNWDAAKGNSRLAWAEAKSAVREGWHHIERKMPGDADGDGR